MKMFNAYLKLEKDKDKKTAYYVISFKGEYPILKELDKFYLMDKNADYIKASHLRKPKYKLAANKGYDHLTGIFLLNDSNWGYGDVKTAKDDLLIFHISIDLSIIEIFVAISKTQEYNLVLNLISNGELNEEIESWRKQDL